ncbi:unnamed protein product [Linum tenue]|uniref:Uncharacterized protein n=2 Tax=Linum tenue TaxID=586396 RepID=A0AAV0MTQ4_9ROSI|nr:unnamed protein product [Linum tenue]CAI0449366.1 unnamed protein product [Linum tenue]CAI0547553.1 unnamed protein product [Linum tenue]CAI0559750.1 unnamed protein product [Linum tenue]
MESRSTASSSLHW